MAKVLEDYGIDGKAVLQQSLTVTKDPLRAIEEFQVRNSILLPSLSPALQLLDLHNKLRLDFHESVFVVLQTRLINEINELSKHNENDGKEKLLAILEKSFPLIKVPTLAPVSICLLKNLKKVPEKYLTKLTNDKELYNICPIEVKRQIWQKNQTLFGDEVLPLLTQYIKEKENMLLEQGSAIFSISPKQRRQCKALKSLTEVIGNHVRLYDMVLQFLRTFYLKTRIVHYCSLRNEILMSLHDDEITDVCSVDPCYKFTWSLNVSIRENFVDSKRVKELQAFLDTIKKNQEKVLGDLSMILCDPFAMNTILCSIMKTINEVLQKGNLPRESTKLGLLIRLLALGQSAWEIIDQQVFKEPCTDKDIQTKFIPYLISHQIMEQCNHYQNKCNLLKDTEDDDSVAKVTNEATKKKSTKKGGPSGKKDDEKTKATKNVLDTITNFYTSDNLCRNILIWHTMNLIKSKKRSQLIDILNILAKSKDVSNNFVYVSILSHAFATSSDLFQDDTIFQFFFNKIFTPTKTLKELQHKAILKLLINISGNKNLYDKLLILTNKWEPKKKACEAIQVLHRQLKEKMTTITAQRQSVTTMITSQDKNKT